MRGEQFLKAAYAYLFIHDFEHAKKAFEQAIACDPENPLYYFHASITAIRSEELDVAMNWATRAVNLEPDNELYGQHLNVVQATILNRNGREACLNGNTKLAKQQFTMALMLDPLNEDAKQALLALEQSVDFPRQAQKEDTG